MVNKAEERRLRAEKRLTEAELTIDLLSAEMRALKAVLRNPPKSPNRQLPFAGNDSMVQSDRRS